MKRTFKSVALLAIFLSASLFVGCSDEDNNNTLEYSNEEVATLLAESIVSSGVYGTFTSMANFASTEGLALKSTTVGGVNENCGVPQTFSTPLDFSEGGTTSSGQYSYTYTLNCVEGIPVSLDALIDLDSTFSGEGFSTTIDMTVDSSLGNFAGTSPFTLEGSVAYDGDSTYEGQRAVFSYSWNVTGGLIDKNSFLLVGGAGTISMTISDGAGGNFSVSAPYTVASNGDLTITINGQSFTIDPDTGLVS